jgi:ATP-binding cassette, subfamily B, bacterial
MLKTYVFEYDLNLNMQPAGGTLSFDETGRVVSRIDGETLMELVAEDMAEASVAAGVGCGLLYVKMSDKREFLLCRFTMSAMKAAGEFCKVVNYYIRTKQCVIPDEQEKPVCETCGRPLAEGMTVCLFCYNKRSVLKRALGLMRPLPKKY